ncbi:hydroxyectoine utilization dehydratase EutB [Maridesulfovibrio bastinii]|uniref:hydroxyectoine utilization dehydratase EutB n=1 Tax=Maridesulfovibrio bastinii TaxID=47157 RepID=UPI0004174272|nr:hydroxyectoine utilization dehydratase EutB [Maridesulfovibrio bastinii]
MPEVSMREVLKARNITRNIIRRTPMVRSEGLSEKTGHDVYLKYEFQQFTGSFKLRGAASAVLSLSDGDKKKGVVGVSTGNYGRALAYAARKSGVKCVICMSELVPENKIKAVKALGAEVRITGKSQDQAQLEVERLVSEKGMIMLPPFDHPDVIAGQGTLGLECMEDCPQAMEVLTPLSGGGLAAGVALAVKNIAPEIKVSGLTMENGAAMYESLKAGKPVQVEEFPSLADSLGGGIGLDNRYTFPMVRDLLDDTILLTEAEIAAGIRYLYKEHGEIVEGAGAVGVAAILAEKISISGPTVVICSGKNIATELHLRIISGETPDLSLG